MKAIGHLIVIIFGITLALPACRKEKSTRSASELLTSVSWQISSYKINDAEVVLMDCQKDNYLTFNTDGTYTDYVGDITCSISETNINGNWSLSADGKILTMESLQGVQTATIEVTESKLILTITDDGDIHIMTCVPYQ
jgi:hypothetical protein